MYSEEMIVCVQTDWFNSVHAEITVIKRPLKSAYVRWTTFLIITGVLRPIASVFFPQNTGVTTPFQKVQKRVEKSELRMLRESFMLLLTRSPHIHIVHERVIHMLTYDREDFLNAHVHNNGFILRRT